MTVSISPDPLNLALGMPKAELHVHIEGTLEPELAFALARRNGVSLPYADEAALKAAYAFDSLQSFLDVYYACAAVLVTRADFCELMLAYLERAAADGVIHAEIFFDPQTHTARGIPFATVLEGLEDGLAEGARRCAICRKTNAWRRWPGPSRSSGAFTVSGWIRPSVVIRRRSLRACSPAAAPWASRWSPTPARKARRPTSPRRSMCWARCASTTACGPSKTLPCSPAWCGRAFR